MCNIVTHIGVREFVVFRLRRNLEEFKKQIQNHSAFSKF